MALLVRARRGDGEERAQSLRRLLDDFRPAAMAAVGKVLGSMGLGGEHGEEAFQRAALRFIEVGLEGFRGDSAPRSYFVRVAISCALDLGREAARRRQLDRSREPLPWQAIPGGDADPVTLLSAQEVRVRLSRCLERLPESYSRGVRRYYLEEAGDCASCAAEQGITKAAFEKRLSRARRMLARCIGEGDHE